MMTVFSHQNNLEDIVVDFVAIRHCNLPLTIENLVECNGFIFSLIRSASGRNSNCQ